jgi:hypothetical protein
MTRNCITSLLAAFMLLCTLGVANAQQGVPQAQPQDQRSRLGEQIPHSWGGLPEDAPPPPQIVRPTPPVHDIPPARGTKLLNDSQQLKLEKELDAARARTRKLEDPNIEKRADKAAAANEAAIKRARKKAGNPKPKEPSKPPSQ